jgi:nucleoside-diphosphate-sugar epimerase
MTAQPRRALVIGPTGAIGKALVGAMRRAGGWKIYGMSRRAPANDAGFTHVGADLLDPNSVLSALSGAEPITHVFYAARAPHGEGGIEDVDANVRMLSHTVEAVGRHSRELRHVHLVEGTKWYGVHLGPHRTPSSEDDPRHLPPNFYYDQEDALIALQRGHGWSWSSCRPNVVCDFNPARARNLTSIIAAYAAICGELGAPLDFPGTAAGYDTLTEVTDGAHLADAILWLATHESGANRAFNVTNGDAFRWRNMWPRLAAMLKVPCGEPRDIRLATWMNDKEQVWGRIADRHGLERHQLKDMALWTFGDFVFRQDWDLLSNLTRLRQTGFAGSVDSAAMFARQFQQYRAARLIPAG